MKEITTFIKKIISAMFVLVALAATGAAAQSGTEMQKDDVMNKLREGRVQNLKGEELGTISYLVMDADSGKAIYAIIQSGEKLYPVPANLIKIQRDSGKLIVDVDRQKFLSAPNFTADTFPDLNDSDYGSRVYKYYGVAPFWEDNGNEQNGDKQKTPDMPPGHKHLEDVPPIGLRSL